MKIQNQESYSVIRTKKDLVINDIKEIEEEKMKIKKDEKVISSVDMIQNYLRKGTHKFNSQPTKEIQLLNASIKEKPVNHLAVLMEAIEKKKRKDARQKK